MKKFLVAILLLTISCKKDTYEFSGNLQVEFVSGYLDNSKSKMQLESFQLNSFYLLVAENPNFKIDIKLDYIKTDGKKRIYKTNELLCGNYYILIQGTFFDSIEYELYGNSKTTRTYYKYFQIIPSKITKIEIGL